MLWPIYLVKTAEKNMMLPCGVGLSVINAGSVLVSHVCQNIADNIVEEAINVVDALLVI